MVEQNSGKIVYTITDEAPALATQSLLPVFEKFAAIAGVSIVQSDISFAARVLSQFPECLKEDQRVNDTLAELGELCQGPDAIIIKTPNISASVPQLHDTIKELRGQGYMVPEYTQTPSTDEEKKTTATYGKVLGSAVNPVLREGNSDRRVADAVKQYAQKNPHNLRPWTKETKTYVCSMSEGDFYGNEQSHIMESATQVKIVHTEPTGKETVWADNIAVMAGEVIDSTFMSAAKLQAFYEVEMAKAKEENVLFSLHLKATMMKKSDPILFGHCVKVFWKDAFTKHAAKLAEIGVNPNNGVGDVLATIAAKAGDDAEAILADFTACYTDRPDLFMCNSDKGITNLHVPSDVIIDASMPCIVRDGGTAWNKDNKRQVTSCCIPDRSYAGVYQAIFDYCRENGQFDVKTMGNVPNVGLMAQKAEEYGSHPKTFEMTAPGTMTVVDKNSSKVYLNHNVESGDIWRMCMTRDAPIQDWVKLAVARAKATKSPAIFWLDPVRAHDRNIQSLAEKYLKDHDTTGLDITFADPIAAATTSFKRMTTGDQTISVTGNVLRDYNTDLFPILELNTSAKMLSIVPMLSGGSMFETGAGGSAPLHVQQFTKENHLRWDSLGEYLATAAAFEFLGERGNTQAALLGKTLNEAVCTWLDEDRTPKRGVNQPDNRSANFYLALYWGQSLAKADASFAPLAESLESNSAKILEELNTCQGPAVDIGGYFHPDMEKVVAAMRPSATMNALMTI